VSNDATIDDPTHGAVKWLRGVGPTSVTPYTGDCKHWGQSVIAYGWDLKHYELVECGIDGEDCGSRAWSDDRGRITTPWMQPTNEDKET
jgi:hypothetical protein